LPALITERKALISFFGHTRNAASITAIIGCLSSG